MIALIKGKIVEKGTNYVVLMAGNVGFLLHIPLSTYVNLPDTDEEVIFYTHTIFRENGLELYGFTTLRERELFKVLLTATGIGAKLGLAILSGIEADHLIEAIAQGDSLRLRSIPGVGKKLAERIIFELKDKIQRITADLTPGRKARGLEDWESVSVSALINLGYPERIASDAVREVRKGSESLEDLIKNALRILGRAKV